MERGAEDGGNAVEMRAVTMIYDNGVAANAGVDFSVRAGEIHALMGENGAGKSTLMKILMGLVRPQEGELFIYGEKVSFASPREAIAKGIGMVHQHFMLVPSLSVAENIALGREPAKGGVFFDRAAAIALTEEYSSRYNLPVDPRAKIADISVGSKQKVEILKALARGAKILILDEPTAVLTARETQELFTQLKLLAAEGLTIIFISHKLAEVKQVTDRMTIMRAGRAVGVYNTRDVSEREVSRLMIGRDVSLSIQKPAASYGQPVLAVENLCHINRWGKQALRDVCFTLRAGEILGIAGVEGNGQSELVRVLYGLDAAQSGSAKFKGKEILGRAQSSLRGMGIAYIPEDRMIYGAASGATLGENLISDRAWQRRFNRGPLLNTRAIREECSRLISEFKILARSPSQRVGMLSGGNIQKAVAAREFSSRPALIIAEQPTRGIDVGAARFIREKMLELAAAGCAVLLVSADLAEVVELSDSLIIMYGGEIVAHFSDTSSLSDIELGEYMLGLRRQNADEIGGAADDK